MQERLADMPEEDLEDMDEDYMLVARMEAGLFTLQQSALIMAHLWFYGDISLRKRILLLLHQQAWRSLHPQEANAVLCTPCTLNRQHWTSQHNMTQTYHSLHDREDCYSRILYNSTTLRGVELLFDLQSPNGQFSRGGG